MANIYPRSLGLEPLRVGVMHIPNQATGRKPQFHQSVVDIANRWQQQRGILLGDTNSGQIGLDEQSPVFNQATHAWFESLSQQGWSDGFRHLHGNSQEYTWYSPNKGNGFRLDQVFVSRALKPSLTNVRHVWGGEGEGRREELSDHAALIVDLL